MAIARIVLGGEVDVCTPGEMGEARDSILGAVEKHSYKGSAKFIPREGRGSGTYPASGNLTIQLGPQAGPSRGQIWNLTQIVILGNDDHTAMANVSASWYLGSDSGNPLLGDCIWPGMKVPMQYEFSKEVLWQNTNQVLYVIVYGGTAGDNYTVKAQYREFRYEDVVRGML